MADNPIYTNDLRKGTRVRLSYGWEAILLDNQRGNIRMAEVFGLYHESGSIYAYDIMEALLDGKWILVTHTQKQLDLREEVNKFLG